MSNVISLIVQRNSSGDVFTTSLLVAEKFNKRHDRVIRKIENLSSETFTRLKIGVSIYTDETGRNNKYYILNRDAFSFIAMSFTGKEAEKWKLDYIDAFNRMESHLRNAMKNDWLEHRAESKVEYRAMTRTLQVVRELEGKSTSHFHYANEAKLINWAMTDKFDKMNRELLSKTELKILTELETLNTALIGAKLEREKRKVMLKAKYFELSMKLLAKDVA